MNVSSASLAGTLFELVALTLTLFVLSWVAIFGGTSALLARSREYPVAGGFALGAIFGPIGWFLIWFLSRGRARADQDRFDPGQDGWSVL